MIKATLRYSTKTPIKHAVVSVFDLFSIGIGPSSSHTVGPMRAAKIFVKDLADLDFMERVSLLRVDLYGSLAMTGVGHGTPNAIIMGLEGETPEGIDPTLVHKRILGIKQSQQIKVNGNHCISFDQGKDLIFHYGTFLPRHPNGMKFLFKD
jgi:L-serine deaminase